MTISQKITDTLKNFDHGTRANEEKTPYTFLKDTAPQSLKDAMYKAHGDRMPDDWIFSKFEDILETMSNYDLTKPDALENCSHEIVDSCVDTYTSDLTEWLASHNENVYYLTEAMEENGDVADGFQILAIAQYEAIADIYDIVADYLTADAK